MGTGLALLASGLTPLAIPSPSDGVWNLGPIPIRGYALCIILGIVAAVWIGEKRWQARGGRAGEVQDIAIWAVPCGLVGGRLYHVATDWRLYFGEGRNPVEALYVWNGGLGIWGAIPLGALGVYLACRRKGIRIAAVLDALAPGVLVAQALGRWGNWFNQELYGKPTDLPWGLEIDRANFPRNCDYPSGSGTCSIPEGTLFHPTFLYESLWCLAGFALILWLERRWRVGHGRVVALYVMVYTLGRGWIEYLRIDDVQLENVGGLRFNVWVSIVLFVAALAYFVWSSRRSPGREESVYRDGFGPEHDGDEDTDEDTDGDTGDDTAEDADRDEPDEAVTTTGDDAPAVERSSPGSSEKD